MGATFGGNRVDPFDRSTQVMRWQIVRDSLLAKVPPSRNLHRYVYYDKGTYSSQPLLGKLLPLKRLTLSTEDRDRIAQLPMFDIDIVWHFFAEFKSKKT